MKTTKYLILMIIVLCVAGCALHTGEEDQQIKAIVADPMIDSEGETSVLPEEWNVIRQYAIDGNRVSAQYFDEHYTYLRKETREGTGTGEFTMVFYQFNIADSEGYLQTVKLDANVRDKNIIPPFLRGFQYKELGVIISKNEALEFAKLSGACDTIKDEDDIQLKWKGKIKTRDGTKYESGFAWDWQGDEGRCYIDAETGAVEYKIYSVLT